jgi:SAM-dependent methyltransferase
MAMKDPKAGEDASALARELADRLAAIATPPPGRAPAALRGSPSGAAPRVSLAGPRAMLENGARFVAPVLPREARLFAAKRLLLRTLRIVTRDQTVFNSALAEALRSALSEIEPALDGAVATGVSALETAAAARDETDAARRRIDEAERRLDESASHTNRLERALAEEEESVSRRLGSVADDLSGALAREAAAREALERDRDARFEALARRQERDAEGDAALSRELGALREDVRQLRLEWTAARRGLTSAPAAAPSAPSGRAVPSPLDAGDPLRAGVYFDFERRFRGSEESIKERQRADAERFRGAPGPVLDLGCGRGEFLELLKEAGVPALGCDANPLMVARAREKGLDAERADLFDFLRGLEDAALGGITAFQVVEHLAPALLYELVELASVKLAIGGRLLFETINPESVFAMKWFWMDLTHVRPVPAPSLEQLLLANGFRDVAVDWRSPVPPEDAADAGDPRLAAIARLLFAPQDYAVTGVK